VTRNLLGAFALLRCYAAYVSSYLSTFRYSLSVLYSWVKQSKKMSNIAEERRPQLHLGGSLACKYSLI